MLDRRSLVASALTLPAFGLARLARADEAVQCFAVERNGTPIGRHTLSFSREGERLRVAIAIDLQVKLAFVTLYRYRHRNEELWEDGRFVGFASSTDDNGTPHEVRARRSGDVILVEGSEGRIEAPGNALPSTYWHRSFLDGPRWIDTQAGRLLTCRVEPRGNMPVATAQGSVAAEGYAVTGDLTLDLWYAGDHWTGLEFAGSDGSRIRYRLERGAPQQIARLG